jgi:dTDP-4-dehydrorhamnose 3,5-epimerase
MNITKTPFDDVLIIAPNIIEDDRGHFFESYRQSLLDEALGREIRFVQENESTSIRGVFRGFHFQVGEHAQAKLIRVISGAVLDIIINLHDGRAFSIELSEDNRQQLFIPNNFAHGFLTLSDTATLQYKCDRYYNKESEAGVNVVDDIFNELFKLPENLIISDKDRTWPRLSELL